MKREELQDRHLENEFIFSTSRSSGPGGQNVNKVNTKVELRFRLNETLLLSTIEKEKIFEKLKNKINKEGELILVSQSERTQLLNKNVVTDKFFDIISKILTEPTKRRSTRPSYSSKIKRLDKKRIRGIVKKMRGKSDQSHYE
jgi:ribosome-associated protein